MGARWSDKEIKKLKLYIPKYSTPVVRWIVFPHRTLKAVQSKITTLGIKKLKDVKRNICTRNGKRAWSKTDNHKIMRG